MALLFVQIGGQVSDMGTFLLESCQWPLVEWLVPVRAWPPVAPQSFPELLLLLHLASKPMSGPKHGKGERKGEGIEIY